MNKSTIVKKEIIERIIRTKFKIVKEKGNKIITVHIKCCQIPAPRTPMSQNKETQSTMILNMRIDGG
jgi:hypothetical protein